MIFKVLTFSLSGIQVSLSTTLRRNCVVFAFSRHSPLFDCLYVSLFSVWITCGKGTRKAQSVPGSSGIRCGEDVWLWGCRGVSSELRAVMNFLNTDGCHLGDSECFPRRQA